ncbi:DNA phosphorothioation-associated putative methyltransferase [Sphingomonas sp. ZB1N12]|uniref:DNA phosphorothioation-associated putative methyltransferase n=1 Tax=Sphingomonas arabinosi TaxID=3096160 RepID=UPI002FC62C04
MDIARHRTALIRNDLSRPLRITMADGLLGDDRTFQDYGCGRGGDVRRLDDAGIDSVGWDPVHAPDGPRRRSSVVNLGYVVNVIERIDERRDTLRLAWALAEEVLVVSARLVDERPERPAATLEDGVVTRLGTFQKFFEQAELKAWIDEVLDVQSVAAAPGVFYVFRRDDARAGFLARRFRRSSSGPHIRVSERLSVQHRDLLDGLAAFLIERGRLPASDELPCHDYLAAALGSVNRAYRLLVAVSDPAGWEEVRKARAEDLLVYLALAKFDGRPRLGELPLDMQRDVKAFFRNYAGACDAADELLFSLGQPERLAAAVAAAHIGKLLPTALYVHVDAVAELPVLLRLYEGCGRAVLGSVDGATLVKLRRDEPKLSYLCYPGFERLAHPPLTESVSMHLQTFKVRTRHYAKSTNPPILHRKETFVGSTHPLRSRFERLTRAEEKAGLFGDTARIGNLMGWQTLLDETGVDIIGHRVVRRAAK